MKTANNITLSVDELAGHWTEPALRELNDAGIHPITVNLEVATWRTLEKVLRAELGFQRSSTVASLNHLKQRAIRRTSGLVAREFGFKAAFTDSEDNDFVRQSRRTDFNSRLRLATVGVAL